MVCLLIKLCVHYCGNVLHCSKLDNCCARCPPVLVIMKPGIPACITKLARGTILHHVYSYSQLITVQKHEICINTLTMLGIWLLEELDISSLYYKEKTDGYITTNLLMCTITWLLCRYLLIYWFCFINIQFLFHVKTYDSQNYQYSQGNHNQGRCNDGNYDSQIISSSYFFDTCIINLM